MTARTLRWLVVPLLVVPLTWLLFTGLGRDPREISSPLVGRPLPQLAGTTLDGRQLTGAELAGSPALVNVWASWCTPCIEEHPVLLGAASDHPQLQLLGVIYQDTTDAARSFLLTYGDGGWPSLLDPNGRLALDLGVTGPPESFFVDAAGIVRAHHVGPLTDQALADGLALIGVTDR
jgi:cytochrome c biogenesis protein CcmG, thiol:disulfide interchange protein DsbE